jgi:hypothetical protein
MQFNIRDSEPFRNARVLRKESKKALDLIRTTGTFEDLPGFIDWRVDHELVSRCYYKSTKGYTVLI